ncbi:MAG TPA: hypothetical protein VF614_16380 [Chthoniobacteraceae bacterium]|jgi:hypothetical protein
MKITVTRRIECGSLVIESAASAEIDDSLLDRPGSVGAFTGIKYGACSRVLSEVVSNVTGCLAASLPVRVQPGS